MKTARYQIVWNGPDSTIKRVPDDEVVPVDGKTYFSNWTPAKRALRAFLFDQRNRYAEAVKAARDLDKWRVERPSKQLTLGDLA